MLISLLKKLKYKLKNILYRSKECRNKDEIYLDLDGLEIMVNRCFSYDKPHEVSVFVPRAELRKKIKNGEQLEEIEILLNSITIVHSPQRPSEEGSDTPIEPPELPKEK
ncbi:hypothetical protein [Halanaerobacter jeridensis]|uniref:Uncharacterized protein n=1 Tax=Halanaerobacter jeridensis TaxID=706427 RepID=A0A938XUJ4_9FIRM|nr:hypothetical protein [Halanaerobacter jeridensis]MBM7558046.1 hypothetical protein [Halanaerobacter jeridensis]